MEISNISRIGGGFNKGIILGVIFFLSACASARKAIVVPESAPVLPASMMSGPPNASEVYGPTASGVASVAADPGELVPNPDRIVLVLGRGLTHGYAYVGALRAIHELKIPVQAIYATEVGALASALYLTQPNPNRIDWALLRFNEKNLGPASRKFPFRLNSPEGELDGKLKEVFGDQRVDPLAAKLHIELQDAKTGEAVDAKSGELWRALRGTLAGANGYEAIEFEGRTVRASARKLAEDYRTARLAEKYPIVVMTAGEPPSDLFRRLLEAERTTLIHIALPGIDDLDLKRRNQAVFAGKNAVHKAATEILGLVGRKPE